MTIQDAAKLEEGQPLNWTHIYRGPGRGPGRNCQQTSKVYYRRATEKRIVVFDITAWKNRTVDPAQLTLAEGKIVKPLPNG